jgi:hypothetical protein
VTTLLQGCIGAAKQCYLPEYMHGFHVSCVVEWFKSSSVCPVCRHDYSHLLPNDYIRLR